MYISELLPISDVLRCYGDALPEPFRQVFERVSDYDELVAENRRLRDELESFAIVLDMPFTGGIDASKQEDCDRISGEIMKRVEAVNAIRDHFTTSNYLTGKKAELRDLLTKIEGELP